MASDKDQYIFYAVARICNVNVYDVMHTIM